jgi:predicted TIM-barrel fold metal-dependent hydrolase
MQKEKAEEKQVLIDKLQRELKSVHSLAEERKKRIESLESESTSKAFSDYKSFRKLMTHVLGVKQIGITDEQILLEVSQYKMSTKFWRQKYYNLCTDIEILVESVGEKIEEAEHRIDVKIIVNRMTEFIKKIEEFKANYNKLSKQVKSAQIYCKALILLRDKLCLQNKTLKEQNLKFSKNVESLEDKCFLQNKIIVVFEELFHQRNETLKLIERNNNLNNELKK